MQLSLEKKERYQALSNQIMKALKEIKADNIDCYMDTPIMQGFGRNILRTLS